MEVIRVPPERILAAGLSPAWQQIMVFDKFQPGEVNRACEVHWCASGKVLNVGIALARLSSGARAQVTGQVEDRNVIASTLSIVGPRARPLVEREFASLNADCECLETVAETRVCTTILDRSTAKTTELVENAPPITGNELSRFEDRYAQLAGAADVIVLTGSMPPGTPANLYQRLLARTPAKAVLDMRGPELLAALDCRPLCVKPNRDELAATVGRSLDTDDDLHLAMRELNRRGAEWVVVTEGAGPVWVSSGSSLIRFQPPTVEEVLNPIGSGDCLAAGIAWEVAHGAGMADAVRFGIACATANVRHLLPAQIELIDALRLQSGITICEVTAS